MSNGIAAGLYLLYQLLGVNGVPGATKGYNIDGFIMAGDFHFSAVNSESINSYGLNIWRSSSFSPSPIYLTGIWN